MVVIFEPDKVSALISLLLLRLDAGWGLHAPDQCREALGELDAPIEVEHDWHRFGLGGWAPQQCQVDR